MKPQLKHDLHLSAKALRRASSIIRPPPNRHAGRWADAHRILPEGSPEPGQWRTSRVPYTEAIYEAFQSPLYSTIVAVMGSQMSKTEMVLNVIGHRFSDGPYVPCLYVGPTEKSVRSMSHDRFDKMLRSTPVLWERLARGQANKVTEKFIAGIRLGFAWAGSATELASHPAGLVILDERDRMTSNVANEGDPVELARARTSNYFGAKIGVVSTPTVQDASPIWSMFEEGTMMKWAWPCWHCSEFFIPCIATLMYVNSEDPEELRESAVVVCPNCGGENESKHKTQLNAAGKYLPHTIDPKTGDHIQIDIPRATSTASFWVSGLCSPWQSFGQRAEQLVRAYKSREPERIQGVINTGFGELYKQAGSSPPWENVYAARTMESRHHYPDWSRLVTMGVDVQKNGLYYVIRAWGYNNRSHLVDHGFLYGDTEDDAVWGMLTDILNQGTDGHHTIALAFVDSGYKPGSDSFRRPEHKVYEYCRRSLGRAFASKGHDELDRPIKATKIDVTSGGRTIKGGLTLWHINTDHIKTWIHSQIDPPENAERLWTLHAETDEDYCRQISAEQLVIKPSGKRTWIHNKRANHYFDCEVMARAAAMSRAVHTIQQPPPAKSERAEQPPPAPNAHTHNVSIATPQKRPFIQQSPSWFSKYRK